MKKYEKDIPNKNYINIDLNNTKDDIKFTNEEISNSPIFNYLQSNNKTVLLTSFEYSENIHSLPRISQ